MSRQSLYFLITLFLISCQPKTIPSYKPVASVQDTTPCITGIGGIFFLSANPQQLENWYRDNLGLKTDAYGAVFEFRNARFPDEINYLRWSVFDTTYNMANPSSKPFVINYRVRNITGLVRNLNDSGAQLLDSITTYEYGKFVHLLDPEGNKIELWEPIDSVLTRYGSITNN